MKEKGVNKMSLKELLENIDCHIYLYLKGELVYVGYNNKEITPYLPYMVVKYEKSSNALFVTISRK